MRSMWLQKIVILAAVVGAVRAQDNEILDKEVPGSVFVPDKPPYREAPYNTAADLEPEVAASILKSTSGPAAVEEAEALAEYVKDNKIKCNQEGAEPIIHNLGEPSTLKYTTTESEMMVLTPDFNIHITPIECVDMDSLKKDCADKKIASIVE